MNSFFLQNISVINEIFILMNLIVKMIVDQKDMARIIATSLQVIVLYLLNLITQRFLIKWRRICEICLFILKALIYWVSEDPQLYPYSFIALMIGTVSKNPQLDQEFKYLVIGCCFIQFFNTDGFNENIYMLPNIIISHMLLLTIIRYKFSAQHIEQTPSEVKMNSIHEKYCWLNDEEGIIMNKDFVIEHNFKEQNTPFFTSEKFQQHFHNLYQDIDSNERTLQEHIQTLLATKKQTGLGFYQFRNQILNQFVIIDNPTEKIIIFCRKREAENLQTLYQVCQSISHELSTSLNSIIVLSSLQMDSEQISIEQKQQFIDPILMNAKQLQLILNNLKDYHSIVTNNFLIQITKFNLINEIDEVIQYFSYTTSSKGMDLKIENYLEQEVIEGDKQRIKQIFYQILSNAVRFTQKGDIIISIKQETSKQILIQVQDQGIGMDDEEKQKLNQLLYQQNPQKISKNSAGCGLGLYITNLLIKQLNSFKQIEFESIPQVGSIFRFYIYNHDFSTNSIKLQSSIEQENIFEVVSSYKMSSNIRTKQMIYSKLKSRIFTYKKGNTGFMSHQVEEGSAFLNLSEEDTRQVMRPPQLIAKSRFISQNLFSEKLCCSKILIVDDEYFNIYALQRVVQSLGWDSDHAFNGQEALKRVETKVKCNQCGQNSYKIIFLDINMPIMDGILAVKVIKEYLKKYSIKDSYCIANTAYSDLQTKKLAFAAGMDYYFTKPIDIQQLKTLIAKLFKDVI